MKSLRTAVQRTSTSHMFSQLTRNTWSHAANAMNLTKYHGRDLSAASVTSSWSPREISLLFKWLVAGSAHPSAGGTIKCGRQPTRVATGFRNACGQLQCVLCCDLLQQQPQVMSTLSLTAVRPYQLVQAGTKFLSTSYTVL